MENAPGMVLALYAFIFIFILAIAFFDFSHCINDKRKKRRKE